MLALKFAICLALNFCTCLFVYFHLFQVFLCMFLKGRREASVEEISNFRDGILASGWEHWANRFLQVLIAKILLVLAQVDSNLASLHIWEVELCRFKALLELVHRGGIVVIWLMLIHKPCSISLSDLSCGNISWLLCLDGRRYMFLKHLFTFVHADKRITLFVLIRHIYAMVKNLTDILINTARILRIDLFLLLSSQIDWRYYMWGSRCSNPERRSSSGFARYLLAAALLLLITFRDRR